MDANKTILDDFIAKHPFAAAQVLEDMAVEGVAEFLQELPLPKTLKLLSLMNTGKAGQCFMKLPSPTKKILLEKGDIAHTGSILRSLDEASRENLLSDISPARSSLIRRRLEQLPDTVGAFMVPAVIVNKEMTTKMAVQVINRRKDTLECYLYVVDLDAGYLGTVRFKELLLADPTDTLEELMITTIPKFSPETPIKNLLDHHAWIEYRYVPVIDEFNKLQGSLSFKTVRESVRNASGTSTIKIMETGSALGELYLIGLTGLLQSVGK